jgi:hypothetical protein
VAGCSVPETASPRRWCPPREHWEPTCPTSRQRFQAQGRGGHPTLARRSMATCTLRFGARAHNRRTRAEAESTAIQNPRTVLPSTTAFRKAKESNGECHSLPFPGSRHPACAAASGQETRRPGQGSRQRQRHRRHRRLWHQRWSHSSPSLSPCCRRWGRPRQSRQKHLSEQWKSTQGEASRQLCTCQRRTFR